MEESIIQFKNESAMRIAHSYSYKNQNGNTILVIDFFNDDMPTESDLLSGVLIYNDQGLVRGDFLNYTTLYKHEDSVYELSTGDVYVEPEQITPPKKEYTEEELAVLKKNEFIQVKENKIEEMSLMCNKVIEDGISIDGKKYSYTTEDQANILNGMSLAEKTGMKVPYHADGESCELYSYDEIAAIYMQEQMNLTKNQTYFNQLKLYIKSLNDENDIETIRNITYGDQLTGEYLEKYNEIMEHSNKIINKLTSGV